MIYRLVLQKQQYYSRREREFVCVSCFACIYLCSPPPLLLLLSHLSSFAPPPPAAALLHCCIYSSSSLCGIVFCIFLLIYLLRGLRGRGVVRFGVFIFIFVLILVSSCWSALLSSVCLCVSCTWGYVCVYHGRFWNEISKFQISIKP